tara:strand:- start:204 stop:893 length:690 start_codon:yes stop_codon:yes gene_type:complete
MCGRKTLSKDIASIIEEMNIEKWEAHGYKPNYNISPTNFSAVLINDEVKKAKMMRWGLVPSWSKNDQIGSKMINARLETIFEKPSFSCLVKSNRCVVLADGYYEWTKQHSQPYYIIHKKNKILPLAGLWTTWQSSNSNTISTYTVITTSPVKSISHLHNRMPFILDDNNIDKWINCNQFTISECLDDIPLEYPNLKFYPVSKIVNSPKNNSIQNIREEKLNETLSFFPN